jgi:hypothetical protein
MRIGVAIREAHDAEAALAAELLRAGERHQPEHDVFHLSRTLHGWCERHLQRLAEHAGRYDLELRAEADPGPVSKPAERPSEPGVLLLHDLRELHLAAARASLAWTVLGQGAQAIGDTELLETVTACHQETIRTMKWTVQKAKEASPQVLAG